MRGNSSGNGCSANAGTGKVKKGNLSSQISEHDRNRHWWYLV